MKLERLEIPIEGTYLVKCNQQIPMTVHVFWWNPNKHCKSILVVSQTYWGWLDPEFSTVENFSKEYEVKEWWRIVE